ncbi:MAG: phosphoenolpyruvate--protein phosphotransferase [Thermoanaerobaculia bacterium]|nr:phosphoenolpyruvate--protein phosphotransferase [Thermoanaerobaculia bacterium]
MNRQAARKGIALSPGIARGFAFVIGRHAATPTEGREALEASAEIARFRAALHRTEAGLSRLLGSISTVLADAAGAILGAQQLMLRDPALVTVVEKRIREQSTTAEGALLGVVEELARAIEAVEDPYLRERAGDVRDVGRRILSELEGSVHDEEIPEGAIIVAHELAPSAAATLPGRVAGVVVETGTRASHTAILLRTAGLPAVGAVSDASSTIEPGSPLLVDGISGLVFVAPSVEVEREYERLDRELQQHQALLEDETDLPTVTRDGVEIHLAANLGKSADVEAALRWKADSVGLFRTEFAFGIRDRFPTEDEQAAILTTVAERMSPRPVVFRLLDLGAEKTPLYFPLAATTNPALGLRGTRLLLAYPEVLRTQLRAILRVRADYDASILLPMVGGVEEVRAVRAMLGEELLQLRHRSGLSVPAPHVGAMIEVPSTLLVADELARECDFLSLGTNDLAQYLLAASRDDPEMSSYYHVLHPAVLRGIDQVVRAAAREGKEVNLCGEAAGDPFYTGIFVGLGLRQFSASPRQFGELRHEVRRLDCRRSQSLVRRLLRCSTREEILGLIESEETFS